MQKYPLKPAFEERMKSLLGNEFEKFKDSLGKEPFHSIRVNELKISPLELKKKLEDKGWKVKQPFASRPEIIIVESQLEPGELGRTFEHLLGYYYVQEISSMMPALALNPGLNERVLDLCASPGSKTTQIGSLMKNTGTIIANEPDFGRMKILSSNLERCGVSNVIITRREGSRLCDELYENGFVFDKILIDAPCSGEGTMRSNPKTAKMWNVHGARKMSFIQKKLITSAIKLIKEGGEIVYSTCTYAPEEDEEIIDFVLRKFPEIEIGRVLLPLNHHNGILKWQDKEYLEDVRFACRIFPFDDNTEGFFIAKLKKIK